MIQIINITSQYVRQSFRLHGNFVNGEVYKLLSFSMWTTNIVL